MNITVFGLGYVGLVTSTCLAKIGHNVIGIDVTREKVELLNSGRSPIVEPGVDEILKQVVTNKRLNATIQIEEALSNSEIVFICVGTPSDFNGEADISAVIKVTDEIIGFIINKKIKPFIVYRSTVPPGTMESIILPRWLEKLKDLPPLLYHPEFLREGSAVKDFFNDPEIIAAGIYGTDDINIEDLFLDIYPGIKINFHFVKVKSAEMIKYVNNTFHALKVTFANEIGRICKRYEIDSHEIYDLFISDKKLNISSAYLHPGFAYGGSCLPKDLKALNILANKKNINIPVIAGIEHSNNEHIENAFNEILASDKTQIGFAGLSFKSGTDDFRESPFVKLAEKCIGRGLTVNIFDSFINFDLLIGKNLKYINQHVNHIKERMVSSPGELVSRSDIIILCHNDNNFINLLRNSDKLILDLTGKFSSKDISVPIAK